MYASRHSARLPAYIFQPHNPNLGEIIGDLRPFINFFDLNDILVMHFQNRNDPALDLLRPQPSVFVTI